MKRVVILSIVLLIMTACSNDKSNYTRRVKNSIIYHKSKNIPSKKITLNLKKINSIKSSDNAFEVSEFMCIDDDMSFYIFNSNSSKIRKFDIDGNYLFEFGNTGQGPGEYKIIGDISFENDLLKVVDSEGRKIIYFDKNGKFISEKKSDKRLPYSAVKVSDNKYVALISEQTTEDGTPYIIGGLSLSDSDFNKITMLYENRIKFDLSNLNKIAEMFQNLPAYTAKDGKIYIAPKDPNRYIIEEFDSEGKKTAQIERSYSKVRYSEKELLELENSTEVSVDVKSSKKSESKKAIGSSEKLKEKYKPAIEELYIDKYNRLWVISSSNKGSGFDLFKDGVFLDRVNPELGEDIRFMGNYIYVINYEDNSIDIYSY